MYKSYEVGTKYWEQIGRLSIKEKITLIKTMETDIVMNKKAYPDEYFHWLITSFEEAASDAKNFRSYRRNSYYIERLKWLRRKNLSLEQKQRFHYIIDNLVDYLPADQVNELLDVYEELTGTI